MPAPSPSPPPRAGSRPPKRGWRALGIALAALPVLFLLTWVILSAVFPPARVRALVSAQLSRTLRREVRFTGASVALLPPVRLHVDDASLAQPGGFARGVAVRAKSLDLDLDPWGLLAHRLVVRRLQLVEPFVQYVVEPDGATNFDSLLATAPSRETAPMDLAVRELDVRGGRVVLDDVRAGRRRTFAIDTKLAFSSEAGGRRIATTGHTTITGVAFGPLAAARLADLNQGLAKLEWKIDHDGKFDAASNRLALANLSLALGKASLALSGVVDAPGPKARLDLKARGANVDLGDVLGALAAADAKAVHGISGSGRVDFDLGIRGAIRPGTLPDLTGTVRVSNGAFRYPGAPVGVEALSFDAQLAPDRIDVGNLRARVAGQPIAAQLGAAHFADPTVHFAVQGTLDLAAIAPLVAPKDTKLAGRAAVDLRGSGRARDPGAMALDGTAQLSGVSIENPKLPKKVDAVNGRLAFSRDRAAITALTAKAGQSSFTLDGEVTRPLALTATPGKAAPSDVRFTFRSPYLDLAELLPPGPGGILTFNANGGGTASIARLKNQKLDVRAVEARVALAPGALEVPSWSFDGYGGRMTGSARFGMEDPAHPKWHVRARADSVQADALLSAWTGAKGVLSGVLNTTIDLDAAGASKDDVLRSLSAAGFAAVLRGQLVTPALAAIANVTGMKDLETLRFKDAKLPFRVQNGHIVTDSVRIAGSNGDWRASGAIGFDGSLDYAVSTTVPAEVAARLGSGAALAAGALKDDQGRLLIDLHIGGTAKSPRIALDTRATRDRLAGRVNTALTEQRQRIESELTKVLTRAPGDSTTKPLEKMNAKDLGKALEKNAGGLLEGLFGKKKPAPPAALPPPPDSAARDTAKK